MVYGRLWGGGGNENVEFWCKGLAFCCVGLSEWDKKINLIEGDN